MSKWIKSLGIVAAILACLTIAAFAYVQMSADAEVVALYQHMAERDFSDEGKSKLSTVKCFERSKHRFTFDDLIFDCSVETICGVPVVSFLFLHNPLEGARFGPDHFSARFARDCPQMLNKNALDWAAANLNQGG